MKYIINCPHCGEKYEVELDFAPGFCVKCGFDMPKVEVAKTKPRLRAEEAMRKMDELIPRLAEARRVYMELQADFEIENQIVRSYARRGIVTEEERQKYAIWGNKNIQKTSVEEILKERRKQKND